MSEVRDWLEGIGPAQHAGAFEADGVDMELLGEVDDQMPKDIGMLSAGRRRGGPCGRLRIGSRSSACLNALSPLPRTTSIPRSSAI